MRHVFDDLARFFLRVDGRFLATLRALFTPGLLTEEYFKGRREKYEKPLRLYVVTLAGALLVGTNEDVVPTWAPAQDRQETATFAGFVSQHPQLISIVFMLLVCGGLTVAYWRKKLRFAEHFVFALHVGSQWNLIGLLSAVLRRFSTTAEAIVSLSLATVVLLAAQRRVYQESSLLTLWRALVMMITVMMSLVLIAVATALAAYLHSR